MKNVYLLLVGIIANIAIQNAFAENYGVLESQTLSRSYNVNELEKFYLDKFCSKLSTRDCQKNISTIKQMPQFGGFDLNANPISKNHSGINKISNIKLIYTSTAARSTNTVKLSGKIILPDGVNKSSIKGVILYFHPTIFDPDSIQNTDSNHSDDIVYAALYASQGYIVVTPDYNGLGNDYDEVHPYVLYPRINDLSGLYMLSAIRHLIDVKYGFSPNDTLKLYTAGFSEGAAYAIWFSRLTQTDMVFSNELNQHNYKLQASVGMDGAYDVSHTIKNFLYDNVNTEHGNPYKIQTLAIVNAVKPGLAAIALMSYGYMSHYPDYSKLFNPQFFAMQCGYIIKRYCLVNHEQKNLYQILRYAAAKNDSEILIPILFSAINKKQLGYEYIPNLFIINTSAQNSLSALANPELVTDTAFNQQLRSADITDWHTNLPINYISLDYDSVVSPINTKAASNNTVGNGANLVKTTWVDNNLIQVEDKAKIMNTGIEIPLGKTNVDHIRAGTFLNIAALHYFNTH